MHLLNTLQPVHGLLLLLHNRGRVGRTRAHPRELLLKLDGRRIAGATYAFSNAIVADAT